MQLILSCLQQHYGIPVFDIMQPTLNRVQLPNAVCAPAIESTYGLVSCGSHQALHAWQCCQGSNAAAWEPHHCVPLALRLRLLCCLRLCGYLHFCRMSGALNWHHKPISRRIYKAAPVKNHPAAGQATSLSAPVASNASHWRPSKACAAATILVPAPTCQHASGLASAMPRSSG